MIDRKEALRKYEEAKIRGEVDEDIIPLLELINSSRDYYTTSSCSGRIVILQIPRIGDKINAKFLGKWHRKVGVDEIRETVKNYTQGYLFLLMQSSIIHVVASSLNAARSIIEIALESGFKYTCIKNIKEEKVMVEILSTENLHIPLGKNGELLVEEKELEFFIEMANEMLDRVKKKLALLEEKLRRTLLSFS